MIGVEDAKQIMMEQARVLPFEPVALASARGGYTAREVYAAHDHPLFDCSAVDGYAFAYDALVKEWTVVGEVPAGGVFSNSLRRGECVRIFTGAMIPAGADTVVMQEYVSREGMRITHNDARMQRGGNVRKQGEQVRQGEVVLHAGQRLNAAAIGLLASLGTASVERTFAPEVAVVITGDEFMEPAHLQPGKIFGSNDLALEFMVSQAGAISTVDHAPDDPHALKRILEQACLDSDLVLTTGGASVGDHDLIRPVLEEMGATIHFHGVAQKPGKPMLFATLGEKPFIALPGNPRAVMVLFWEYVYPFLQAMQGAREPMLRSDRLPITQALQVRGDRFQFRAALVEGGKVMLLKDEGSHMLRSLVEANALAYLPADRRAWAEGDTIEVHYLPQ